MAPDAAAARFRFESGLFGPDKFSVLSFDGEEAISRLFHFEIELTSNDAQIDLGEVLNFPATLYLEAHGRESRFHGILAEFELTGELANGLYSYRAVLVPRLWLWSLSRQNQIHQNMTIKAIVEQELGDTANKGEHPLIAAGLRGADDLQIALDEAEYAQREYVVQYRESDLDFLSRLMEHEGIFYFFEHGMDAEKLFVGDHNTCFPEIAEVELPYRLPAGLVDRDSAAVHAIRYNRQQVPHKVLLRDYNYREPHVLMQAEREVKCTGQPDGESARGVGFIAEYGAHFKEEKEGGRLADARAEALASAGGVFEAESDCTSVRSGHCFTLSEHFRDDFNAKLLVTRVRHSGEQSVAAVSGVGAGKTGVSYRNEFSAIPFAVPFRPARITPKPRLYGIMNGTIDGEQEHGRAEIDADGRYKVKMPFDISGAAAGKASRYLRMAQPYAGAHQGMHFPLHPGTEVIWACVDGDLDRPIILSAVPNPETRSVVTAENSASNVIRTASGISMSFHDGTGSGAPATAGSGDSLAAQQHGQSIGTVARTSRDGANRPEPAPPLGAAVVPVPRRVPSQQPIAQQQQRQPDAASVDVTRQSVVSGINLTTTDGKQWALGVPDYMDTIDDSSPTTGSQDSYLRMGKASEEEERIGGGFETNGWLDYTDGDHTSITQGARTDYTQGEHTVKRANSRYAYNLGYSHSYTITADNSHSLGLKVSSFAGLKVSSSLFANVSIKSGADFNFSHSRSYSYTKGRSFSSASNFIRKAKHTVRFKVDPVKKGAEEKLENGIPKYQKYIVAASSAVAAAISVGGKYGDKDVVNRLADAHGILVTAGAIGLMGYTGWNTGKTKQSQDGEELDEPASEFFMDDLKAELKVVGTDDNKKKARTIRIFTSDNPKKNNEKQRTGILVKRDSDVGRILLTAGAEDGEPDSGIYLKVGKSSIIVKDDKIVFNSPAFEFKNAKENFVAINKDGLNVNTGDLQVHGGAMFTDKVEADTLVANTVTSVGGGKLDGGSPPTKVNVYKFKKLVESNLDWKMSRK